MWLVSVLAMLLYSIPVHGAEGGSAAPDKTEVLRQRRTELIETIRQALRVAREGETHLELSLRLARLLREDYIARVASSAGKPKHGAKSAAEEWARSPLEEAVQIYQTLNQRYATHPLRPEILYFLGVTYFDRQEDENGVRILAQLVSQYPNSEFIENAQLQLAEFYFGRDDLKRAEELYDRVLSKTTSTSLTYAFYRKAWCAFRLGRVAEALDLFKKALAHDGSSGERNPGLRAEIWHDVAIPFTELGQLDSGMAFFQSEGPSAVRVGWSSMASLSLTRERPSDAIRLWTALINEDPSHPENLSLELSALRAMVKQGSVADAAHRALKSLPQYFEPSVWTAANGGQAAKVVAAQRDSVDTWIRECVTKLHAGAQTSKSSEAYAVSARLYSFYLTLFPGSPSASEMRFALAEIQYRGGDFSLAARNYHQVARESQIEGRRAEAMSHALSSAYRLINQDRKASGVGEILATSLVRSGVSDAGAQGGAASYAESETYFLSLVKEYAGTYPQAKDLPDSLYVAAYLQFLHQDYEAAVAGFSKLAERKEGDEIAYRSAHAVLDIHAHRKDYKSLIHTARKFVSFRTLSQETFRRELGDIIRRSELKMIQELEETKRFAEAGDAYRRYVSDHGSEDADLKLKAIHNGIANFVQAGLLPQAVKLESILAGALPRGERQAAVLLELATHFQRLADFDRAADTFNEFVQKYPSHPESGTARRLETLLYWAGGRAGKARSSLTEYLASRPVDGRWIEGELSDLYSTAEERKALASFHRALMARKGISPTEYIYHGVRAVELESAGNAVNSKDIEPLVQFASNHAAALREQGDSASDVVKLLAWDAQIAERTYEGVRLVGSPSQVEAATAKKLELLQSVDRRYQRLIHMGISPWTQMSQYRIARAYREMVDSVRAVPVPSELTVEQVDSYRTQLEEAVLAPLLDKAKAALTQCLSLGGDGQFASWSGRCRELSQELDPGRFPKQRIVVLPAVRVSPLVVKPEENSAQTAIGSFEDFAYPFFSSGLFGAREGHMQTGEGSFWEGMPVAGSGGWAGARQAIRLTYQQLSPLRQKAMQKWRKQAEREGEKTGPSLAVLHALRILSPERAIPTTLAAIQLDPMNDDLHNLLGLTYFDLGNVRAAKTILLTLLAKSPKNGAVLNNLGVIAASEGRKQAAFEYFSQAAVGGGSGDAWLNLAWMRLENLDGANARQDLERASAAGINDAQWELASFTSLVLERNGSAKDAAARLAGRFGADPYARLAVALYYIDQGGDAARARDAMPEAPEGSDADDIRVFLAVRSEVQALVESAEEAPRRRKGDPIQLSSIAIER